MSRRCWDDDPLATPLFEEDTETYAPARGCLFGVLLGGCFAGIAVGALALLNWWF